MKFDFSKTNREEERRAGEIHKGVGWRGEEFSHNRMRVQSETLG